MIIGFTGTRRRITVPQYLALRHYIVETQMRGDLHIEKVVHGDCIGADAVFDRLVCDQTTWMRELFPSNISDMRANTHLHRPERVLHVHLPAPPLERNVRIVRRADLILACPRGAETLRSGTWATIRLARKQEVPVRIIWPDGSVE